MIHVSRCREDAARIPTSIAALILGVALGAAVSFAGEAAAKQKVFETPEAAFASLMAAIGSHDEQVKLDILGHEHADLVVQSDKEWVREGDRRIFEAYEEFSNVVTDDDGRATLTIGSLGWPFPIAVVREEDGWRFDTEDGKEEIINRRIGRNELAIIELFEDYGDAQIDYASEDWDADEVLEYAQRLVSTEGEKDGLYWEVAAGSDEPVSPFGPLVAEASEYLRGKDASSPYMGYYVRILTRQGANPPGGAYDYVINGNMIAGFGLLAYPADYGASGVMTFVVNHQGKIHQKDLGEKTAEIAGEIDAYDPDATWTWVQEVGDPLE
jgi:hypothetical protein